MKGKHAKLLPVDQNRFLSLISRPKDKQTGNGIDGTHRCDQIFRYCG
jgi:hypothetical protein